MNVFSTQCTHCFAQHDDLRAGEFRLKQIVGGRAMYSFVCSECNHTVEKPAEPRVIYLLTQEGVVLEPLSIPEQEVLDFFVTLDSDQDLIAILERELAT